MQHSFCLRFQPRLYNRYFWIKVNKIMLNINKMLLENSKQLIDFEPLLLKTAYGHYQNTGRTSIEKYFQYDMHYKLINSIIEKNFKLSNSNYYTWLNKTSRIERETYGFGTFFLYGWTNKDVLNSQSNYLNNFYLNSSGKIDSKSLSNWHLNTEICINKSFNNFEDKSNLFEFITYTYKSNLYLWWFEKFWFNFK